MTELHPITVFILTLLICGPVIFAIGEARGRTRACNSFRATMEAKKP